jgi:hypothetical protein
MMTARPEIFAGNPDPTQIIPPDAYYAKTLRCIGSRVVQPYYSEADPSDPDRDRFPPGHVLARMCRLAGLEGSITLRPYFHLTPEERAAGRRAARQIAIQSTGSGAALPSANKEWDSGRFASVVRDLPSGCTAVQLGVKSDPPLPGALDLRGRTSLRGAAAVLSASEAFVGLEGFLAHLARAVECPAVIVLGGRTLPDTFGYPGNEYLSSPTPCTPCGLRSGCDFGRACLTGVGVDAVLAALGRILSRAPGPLPEATALI